MVWTPDGGEEPWEPWWLEDGGGAGDGEVTGGPARPPIPLIETGGGETGGGETGGYGGGYGGFDFPAPSGSIGFDWSMVGAVPRFIAPRFTPPTAESLLNEPGYQFRLGEGRRSLEASAAARGVLRSGGTLTDVLKYGQSFASNEYANAFNRALESFDRQYRGARDEYAPLLFEWQTRASSLQRQRELEWLKQWERYFFERDLGFRQEEGILNRSSLVE